MDIHDAYYKPPQGECKWLILYSASFLDMCNPCNAIHLLHLCSHFQHHRLFGMVCNMTQDIYYTQPTIGNDGEQIHLILQEYIYNV